MKIKIHFIQYDVFSTNSNELIMFVISQEGMKIYHDVLEISHPSKRIKKLNIPEEIPST